jgi:voltage-gated potassium channel
MKTRSNPGAHLRQVQASFRDTWLLLREFGWPLILFTIAVIGGGIFYYRLSILAGEPVSNLLESVYQVLLLTFLQPLGDFPRAWYLEIFYFAMPLIGLIILSQGVAEFSAMFFNRRQRSKEWEMAVASTFQHHHILIGLGHLGFRVANSLHEMGQDVVVIELNPSADLVASVKKLGIPVIQDDAAREAALESAGIHRARTVLLCTQNDSLNLQVALRARRMNKNINVVVRIFDNDFATALQEQFGFTAFSATQMAAPIFAAAAAGVDMTQPITIEGQPLSLAKMNIRASSKLVGMSVSQLEEKFNVSVVLLRRGNSDDLHPAASVELHSNDILAILGGPAEITRLVQENL